MTLQNTPQENWALHIPVHANYFRFRVCDVWRNRSNHHVMRRDLMICCIMRILLEWFYEFLFYYIATFFIAQGSVHVKLLLQEFFFILFYLCVRLNTGESCTVAIEWRITMCSVSCYTCSHSSAKPLSNCMVDKEPIATCLYWPVAATLLGGPAKAWNSSTA